MMPPQWYQDTNSMLYCSEVYASRLLLSPAVTPPNGTVSAALYNLNLPDKAIVRLYYDGYLTISADGREPGGLVMSHYCMLCGRGTNTRGNGPCEHKALLIAWNGSRGEPVLFPDHDDRREAYYRAELYPPNPLH